MPELLIASLKAVPVPGARIEAGAGAPVGGADDAQVPSFDALMQAGLAATQTQPEIPGVGVAQDTSTQGQPALPASAAGATKTDAEPNPAGTPQGDAVTDLLALIAGLDSGVNPSSLTPGASSRQANVGAARAHPSGALPSDDSGSNVADACTTAAGQEVDTKAAATNAARLPVTATPDPDADPLATDANKKNDGRSDDAAISMADGVGVSIDPATGATLDERLALIPDPITPNAAVATASTPEAQPAASDPMAAATASALRGLSPFPRAREPVGNAHAVPGAAPESAAGSMTGSMTGSSSGLASATADAPSAASIGAAGASPTKGTEIEFGRAVAVASRQDADDQAQNALAAQGASMASATAQHHSGTMDGLAAAAAVKADLPPDFGMRATAAPVLLAQQPLGSQAWKHEFGTQVTFLVSRREPQAEIRLNPEDLGPVQVRIGMQGDEVSVAFSAQQAETRAAIEAALPALREMLAGSGLTLGQSSVSAESSQGQGDQGQPASADRRNSPDPTQDSVPEPAVLVRRSAAGLVDTFA